MSNVLLLREPSTGTPDRYEAVFSEAGYSPISIPVLETVLNNLDLLCNIIKNGAASDNLSGVIITSKRSCDAWRGALQLLQNSCTEEERKEVAAWYRVPFYLVGEATASALKDVFLSFSKLGLSSSSVDVRGQHSGNASALGNFILDDVKRRPVKLLYLTGDKNRDTITDILRDRGVELHTLQVYETQESPSFEKNLVSHLHKDASKHWWLVYFAPSAASFATPTMRKYFFLEEMNPTSTASLENSNLPRTKVAAIGRTTDTFLKEELNLHVHAVAHKPSPEDLLAAIDNRDY